MDTPLSERIVQIPQAISPAVCAGYIQLGDQVGWTPTDIERLNPAYSRSQAYVPIDLAALYAAILPAAPTQLDEKDIASLAADRTALMRYSEGEFMGLHTDVPFVDEQGAAALLSLILYLNDDYEGGQTAFPGLSFEAQPAVGKILLFPPNISHLSKPIVRGSKYIIRSEVLYRPAAKQ